VNHEPTSDFPSDFKPSASPEAKRALKRELPPGARREPAVGLQREPQLESQAQAQAYGQAYGQAPSQTQTQAQPQAQTDAPHKTKGAAKPHLRVQAPAVERRRSGKAVLPYHVRWWWWRSYVAAVPLAAALIACVGVYFVPPKFTAMARLLPPQANASSAQIMAVGTGGSTGLGMAAMGTKSPSEMYAQLFTSRSVQATVIEKLKLVEHYGVADVDEAYFELSKNTVSQVNRAGLIEVSVTDADAQRSADITNALITGMYDVGRRMTQDAARRQIAFYDNLITETRERLKKADDELLALEAKTGLTRLRTQEEATTSRIMSVKYNLAERQVELARLRRSATELQPEVQRVRAEVEALTAQLANLEAPLARGRNELVLPPGEYAELRRAVEPARREVDSLTNVLQNLQKSRENTRIDDSRDFSTIVVLDAATKPAIKSWPVTGRVMLSAFAGALLLVLAIAFGNSLRHANTSAQERRRQPLIAVA
jgi:tyrosine-protein kinase Etk/Wzc